MDKEEAKQIKRQDSATAQLAVWLEKFTDGTKVKVSWSDKVFLVELKSHANR
jgi:hypothetical protein